MAFLYVRLLLLAVVIWTHDSWSMNSLVSRNSAFDLPGAPERRLSAAKRSDKLGRRDVTDCLRYAHELHYLDANTAGSNAPFGAKVAMNFNTPTLLLEDIEHHFKKVECFDSSIYLRFRSVKALNHAYKNFENVDDLLVVTSHEGCNANNERDAYLVSGSAVHLEDQVLVLFTTQVPWKDTFKSMTLEFGEHEDNMRLSHRHHGQIRPRQAAATSQIAASTSANENSAASTSYDYPAAPTTTASTINVTDNVYGSYINKTVLPLDPSLGQLSASGPKLSGDFNIKCKNCTFQGSINLVSGSLTTGPFKTNDTKGFLNETEAVVDYIESGFIQFSSTGFTAHVELDNTIGATDKLESFSVPLPTIPITPLLIPGIASVGPQLEPALTAGFQLSADLEFGYGFEVKIPDNSSLKLDLATRNGSSQQGFDDTTINGLPFQASIPDVELTLTAGFSPSLLLGISFFSGDAIAGAGFFLDAPLLTTTLSTVRNVDSGCNNASSSTAKNAIFDTLTHINASAEINLGVIAKAEVTFPGDSHLQDVDKYAVYTKTFDLPTACMSFDAAAKTYGAAKAHGASSSTTGTAAAGARPTKSVGVAVFGHGDKGFGRMMVAIGSLVAVCAAFALF